VSDGFTPNAVGMIEPSATNSPYGHRAHQSARVKHASVLIHNAVRTILGDAATPEGMAQRDRVDLQGAEQVVHQKWISEGLRVVGSWNAGASLSMLR